MKTKLNLLRLMIRETVLREMPLAGIVEPENERYVEPQSMEEDPEEGTPQYSFNKNAKNKVQRFFKTPKFHDDAVKYFKGLSVPIYLVPTYSSLIANPYERNYLYDDSDQSAEKQENPRFTSTLQNILQRIGLSDEKAAQLETARKNGAAIFIINAGGLEQGFLPTPWMSIHAIFDDDHNSILREKISAITQLFRGDFGRNRKLGKVVKCLTMKSARNNEVDGINDTIAEILCQAILTTSGFVFNQSDDESINDLLEEIASIVKDAKQEFEKQIRGKILDLDVILDQGG